MKKDETFEVIDQRGELNADNSTAIPNDLVDKYGRLFKGKQYLAVLDLIRQAYKAGVQIARDEAQSHRA